ncbi:MAG: pseudaminic acid synthase [Gammaproteobacteria bacterium]|jgi:N-acetylneuraminate synthase|nr:pseudaminic acid synthase [Gammaproteobacteria bacterium]
MNKVLSIAGRAIGQGCPPYVVAELSANHNGDIERAKAIIDAAVAAGADAVKLQTYSADTLTIDHDAEDFQIRGGLWDGRTLYQLYQWAQMPWAWHRPLFDYARERGITIFSSPFDESAVDLLEELDAPAYKIASFEIVDLPLIQYAAATGKPLIISTGMASPEDIAAAVATARAAGCRDLVLLHCVSGYPAPAAQYNLLTLQDIAARFDVLVGLSDHTIDNATAVAAVALGACFIEKHVTLDRSSGGPDDSFSLEPPELRQLVTDSRTAWEALGQVTYERQQAEQQNVQYRRSLYVVKDLRKGEVITPEHVRSIRPGFGLAPEHAARIIGRRAAHDAAYGTPVAWELIGDDPAAA